MKKLSKEEFLKYFTNGFYNKTLKESLISYKKNIKKAEAKEKIYNAYEKLFYFDYFVANPTEYIYLLKNEYVARIMPVFSIEDEAIYFYLCKQIEKDIAKNRIKGTFGGWVLGNNIKKAEDDEIQYTFNSYNPWLWTKYWKKFQRYIYTNIEKYNYKYALKLDIANFYDSINLDLLSKKLYKACEKENFEYIELIIYILKYWNRKYNNYGENDVGIPQNEFGDQSRLLANLYLNEYDDIMYNVCTKNNAMYSRYADDQIILFNEKIEINNIMLVANDELKKIGLNINSNKTQKYNKDELINYYLFEPLKLLEIGEYDRAVKNFFSIIRKVKNIKNVRSDTFFKRCLSIGLYKFSKNSKNKIIKYISQEEFIINSNANYLYKTYINLNFKEKIKYINDIKDYFELVKFNGFHYSVINFFKKARLNDDYKNYIKKIDSNKTL